MKKKEIFKTILILLLAALLRAFAVQVLLVPNMITIGGIMGLASLVYFLTNGVVPLIVGIIGLNIPLIIVAYFVVGKKFAIKTLLCVVFMALFTYLFDVIDLNKILGATVQTDKLLYAIIAGALSGASLAVSFSVQASTGGTDILALIVQRKYDLSNVPRITMVLDVIVLFITGLVMQSFDLFMFSIATVFVSEVAVEYILRGSSQSTAIEIVTTKPQEVIDALVAKIGDITTSIKVKGMYSNTDKTMVIAVVSNRQVNMAKAIVKQIDDKSFTYLVSVKEVVNQRNTTEDN